jgi:hypothetical protein
MVETINISDDMKAKASLYAKLARVMGQISRLPKEGRNTFQNYDYVTDTTVADAVRKALAAENVAFFASMTSTGVEGELVVSSFEFTFADGDTGATVTTVWFGEARRFASRKDGKDSIDDKAINKTATAAEKYFLLKTFLLSTGDEPDADADELPDISPEGAARNYRKQAQPDRPALVRTSATAAHVDTPLGPDRAALGAAIKAWREKHGKTADEIKTVFGITRIEELTMSKDDALAFLRMHYNTGEDTPA